MMPTAAVRVTISLPKDLNRAIEEMRKKVKKSRNAVVQEALRNWLNEQEYIEGYRRMPETRREIEEAMATAKKLFMSKELEWE